MEQSSIFKNMSRKEQIMYINIVYQVWDILSSQFKNDLMARFEPYSPGQKWYEYLTYEGMSTDEKKALQ